MLTASYLYYLLGINARIMEDSISKVAAAFIGWYDNPRSAEVIPGCWLESSNRFWSYGDAIGWTTNGMFDLFGNIPCRVDKSSVYTGKNYSSVRLWGAIRLLGESRKFELSAQKSGDKMAFFMSLCWTSGKCPVEWERKGLSFKNILSH